MNDVRVASRYAKSLLQLAIELDKLEQVKNDMEMISTACKDSKELGLLLKSPLVKPDKKQTILNEVFGGSVSELSQNFLDIITRKKRENSLEVIADQFLLQYKTYKNIEVAYVKTAVPLTKELKKEIPELVKNAMDSKSQIELVEEVDESLLGGIILRVGDRQLDGSIRKKLMALEMEFSRNPYVKKY